MRAGQRFSPGVALPPGVSACVETVLTAKRRGRGTTGIQWWRPGMLSASHSAQGSPQHQGSHV